MWFFIQSKKTLKIIYNGLSLSKDSIAYNPMADTYWGYFLSSFNVKFIDLKNYIIYYNDPTSNSLITRIIDHRYKDKESSLMIKKYEYHEKHKEKLKFSHNNFKFTLN